MDQKTVAVVGASADRAKYGNMAVRAYVKQGWTVHPVNPGTQRIEGLPVYSRLADVPGPVDRVSLYLPPEQGMTVLDQVAELKPDGFFVNPGAESEALLTRARELGLEPIVACSIVAVGLTPEGLDDPET